LLAAFMPALKASRCCCSRGDFWSIWRMAVVNDSTGKSPDARAGAPKATRFFKRRLPRPFAMSVAATGTTSMPSRPGGAGATEHIPLMISGSLAGSGTVASAIASGRGALVCRSTTIWVESWCTGSNIARRSPNGSGQATKQSPHPVQRPRSMWTGTNPVAG
jgi:hypothetical protein